MKKWMSVSAALVATLALVLYFSPLGAQVTAFVNGLVFINSATGSNPQIAATGSDTNIGITFAPKGTGTVQFTGGSATGVGQHLEFHQVSAPTIAGGTASIVSGSTDVAGRVNTGNNPGATLTFVTAWTNAPFCTATLFNQNLAFGSSSAPDISALSTTGFTVTGLQANQGYTYTCIGQF